MANESMAGIYKVGMTTRDPAARLAEANKSDTWRPPTDYTVAYAVRVCDVLTTEHRLHGWMAERGWRINSCREFFKAPLRDIKSLMDNVEARAGDGWTARGEDTESDDEEDVDIHYHPSVMPKKALEPAGAATRMHLRSGLLVKPTHGGAGASVMGIRARKAAEREARALATMNVRW